MNLLANREDNEEWSEMIRGMYGRKYIAWKKYSLTLRWEYLTIVKTKGLEPNVTLKIAIKKDEQELTEQNTSLFSGEISVFDENSKKFNKLLKIENLEILFGGSEPPDGKKEEGEQKGLPLAIVEAELKLIEAAMRILD